MTTALRVVRVPPGATIQDLGRRGRLHEGLPPSGALIPELLVATNRSLGNDDGAACLELPLSSAAFESLTEMTISIDGEPRPVRPGAIIDVRPTRAATYIGVPGGVDVPLVLGSRSTLLVARIGGLDGRMLRAGDVIAAHASLSARPPLFDPIRFDDAPIRLQRGPDDFADGDWEQLLRSTWTIARAFDRVGVRLDGPKLPARPADRRLAMPMIRGAIQVTADGTPIVLGPDHPATGGYPVIGCVVTRDLGRLAAKRPGVSLSFASA